MGSILVIKRDGSEEYFDRDKVAESIFGAAVSVGGEDMNLSDELADKVLDMLEANDVQEIASDELQRIVEDTLINEGHATTARQYILKGADRKRIRELDTSLIQSFEELTFKSADESDTKRENGNIDSNTSMGTMLKYGSESAKLYNLSYLLSEDIVEAHKNCDIHIHDLDFLALTSTCDQIPLDELFNGGFNTGHGFLREPGNIRTAAALTAIALQSNQNDQHGGQSIPMLDHYLSPYVALSYIDNIAKETKSKFDLTKANRKELKRELKSIWKKHKHLMNDSGNSMIKREIKKYLNYTGVVYTESNLESILRNAYDDTYDDTFQAMEGLVHNLNTMHSRAGAQVPFSSVNYGTDLSQEGRIIQETILKTTWDGLGNGETPIFPIQILKLKKGVNIDPQDPYYDIFELACKVSAKRLYPNFVNLDAPYNKELYVEGHPETEMATMGCRTRVGKNVYDPSKSVIPGRGNLSFTSINLPRLGIKANGNLNTFYKMLDAKMELVHKELLERLAIISKRRPINYPFLMGQNCWVGSEKLGPIDQIKDVWKHGTLAVGFIGLAETLVALTGKHHGESEESQKLGLEIVSHMRQITDKWSEEEKLNYSVIGTPAEGLSGRFIKADKKLFGIIPGVTDKGYYTNSSHVPVYYSISAKRKIDIEAPYHEIENGGHILYIEMDGDPTKNVKAFMKVVRYMYDKNAGYMAINHPVDRDPVCGYVGIIDDACPRCGRKDGEPMSIEMWNKLKGFANVGNADTLGYHGDAEEEMNRSSNKMDL